METVSIHLSTFQYLLSILGCIFLNNTFMALEKFFPKYLPYISLFTSPDPTSLKLPLITKEKEFIYNRMVKETETTHKQNIGVQREEIGFIMSEMGMSLSQEGDQVTNYMSEEEFSTLFDQKEPGLDEVKEAFSIFDQNRDGFIDAKELQTMLITLGLREGTDLDACQSMIKQHDRNHDGKIDLSDFFKLLECSLL